MRITESEQGSLHRVDVQVTDFNDGTDLYVAGIYDCDGLLYMTVTRKGHTHTLYGDDLDETITALMYLRDWPKPVGSQDPQLP